METNLYAGRDAGWIGSMTRRGALDRVVLVIVLMLALVPGLVLALVEPGGLVQFW